MNGGTALWIICYDVSGSARRRRRVTRVLADFGARVQKSAFECRLDPAGHRSLMARLDRLLEPDADLLACHRIPEPHRIWQAGADASRYRVQVASLPEGHAVV